MIALLAIGGIFYAGVIAFMVGACKVAAQSDRIMEQHNDQL